MGEKDIYFPEVDAAYFPVPTYAGNGVTYAEPGQCSCIYAKSEHIEEAKLWVEFLATPEISEYYCTNAKMLSPIKGVEPKFDEAQMLLDSSTGYELIKTNNYENSELWTIEWSELLEGVMWDGDSYLQHIVFVTYHLDAIRDTKIGNALYMVIISAMFIPSVCGVTSLMLRRKLGLYNNLTGEILVSATAIDFGIFIASGFLRTIPRELQEAAKIDGANDWHIMTKVIVPVIKPALVSVGILNFTALWNNTTGALLTLRSKELYTIPMALLLNFTQQVSVQYEIVFAGVLLTSIPLVIVYCYCQKYFVSALAGSVKG